MSAEITQLEQDLEDLVAALVPELLEIPKACVVTAARILRETGDIRRFRSPVACACTTAASHPRLQRQQSGRAPPQPRR